MRRILVAGGFGFFGSALVEQLRADGLSPLVASRRPQADIGLDVEDRRSIQRVLRPEDVVVDAIGPYQARSTALVEAAIDQRFDVIDLADSIAYVRAVSHLRDRIDKAGIRVYSACSAFSAITAALVRSSGITEPQRVTGFLVPAARHSAALGTGASLWHSIGGSIETWTDGRPVTRPGWRTTRRFPMPKPIGLVTGHLFETPDSLLLPGVWPTLRTVESYVDTNVLGLNRLFGVAARVPAVRTILHRCQRLGLVLARRLAGRVGGLGYEVESSSGRTVRLALVSLSHGYRAAIVPAAMVAKAIAGDPIGPGGLVPPNLHVEPTELLDRLHALGISLQQRSDDGTWIQWAGRARRTVP